MHDTPSPPPVLPTPGVANTSHGAANTVAFTAFTSFLENFDNFSKCFQLLFKKCSKDGLVSKKKNIFSSLYRGGSDPKMVKITFFEAFPYN